MDSPISGTTNQKSSFTSIDDGSPAPTLSSDDGSPAPTLSSVVEDPREKLNSKEQARKVTHITSSPIDVDVPQRHLDRSAQQVRKPTDLSLHTFSVMGSRSADQAALRPLFSPVLLPKKNTEQYSSPGSSLSKADSLALQLKNSVSPDSILTEDLVGETKRPPRVLQAMRSWIDHDQRKDIKHPALKVRGFDLPPLDTNAERLARMGKMQEMLCLQNRLLGLEEELADEELSSRTLVGIISDIAYLEKKYAKQRSLLAEDPLVIKCEDLSRKLRTECIHKGTALFNSTFDAICTRPTEVLLGADGKGQLAYMKAQIADLEVLKELSSEVCPGEKRRYTAALEVVQEATAPCLRSTIENIEGHIESVLEQLKADPSSQRLQGDIDYLCNKLMKGEFTFIVKALGWNVEPLTSVYLEAKADDAIDFRMKEILASSIPAIPKLAEKQFLEFKQDLELFQKLSQDQEENAEVASLLQEANDDLFIHVQSKEYGTKLESWTKDSRVLEAMDRALDEIFLDIGFYRSGSLGILKKRIERFLSMFKKYGESKKYPPAKLVEVCRILDHRIMMRDANDSKREEIPADE